MTDRESDIDGQAGGTAGSASGTADGLDRSSRLGSRGGPRCGRGGQPLRVAGDTSPDPRSANVVPFPGSWFGSVDDLVPIHPEPEPASVTEADPGAAAIGVELPDASAFWGETSQVVPVSTGPGPSSDSAASSSIFATDHAARAGRRRGPLVMLAGVLVALLAAGVLVAVQALPKGRSIGERHPGPGHATALKQRQEANVVTQTRTVVSSVTVTRRASTARHRSRHRVRHSRRTGSGVTTVATLTPVTAPVASTPSATPPTSSADSASSAAGDAAKHSHASTPTSDCGLQSPDSGCAP